MVSIVQAAVETDDVLMARISDGDQAAFGVFSARHYARIKSVAQRLIGNPSDAEEIVQDALMRVWRYATERHEGKAHADTWLNRIVTNLAIDRIRQRGQVLASIDEASASIDPAPTPQSVAEAHELAQRMAEAISRLPARQREALSLCFYQELECSEAALAMHISVSAMEALLVRARRAIRRHLTLIL
jgi:RNA polymerase sigma-70 factor (ECF subfamily)